MKKELIGVNDELELRNNLDIEEYKRKLKELKLRLKDLTLGYNDSNYMALLEEIKNTKNNLLGLLFLRKSLKESLRNIEEYSPMDQETFRGVLRRDLEVNKIEIEKSHREYQRLLKRKDEYHLKTMKTKQELEQTIEEVQKKARDLTSKEFVNEVIKVFRSNHFEKMYDTKDEYLGYSMGQIFILQYAITNLVRYYDSEDLGINLQSQINLLKTYEFKNEGKVKNKFDFVKCLENGDIHLCSLERPVLPYKEALRLYKQVSNTFHLPRIMVAKVRRRLK